ncbi:MAG: NAD(P)H-binding protein [Pseudomonadota bacterium]
MKLIVFGANGILGQWVWRSAIKAGHDTVAYVRSPDKLDQTDPGFSKLTVVTGDVMDADAVRHACADREVCINCTSPAGGNSTIELAQSIVTNAKTAGIETFYMVGGLGALWVPGSNRSTLVQDWGDVDARTQHGLPAELPLDKLQMMTKGHLASMAFMEEAGVHFTFMCPGAMIDAPATPNRVVTLDELGGSNTLRVNAGDVADVMVGDIGKGALLGHRVSVAAS